MERRDMKKIILKYVVEFARNNGYCPSLRDISTAGLGIISISTISGYINALVAEGELVRPTKGGRVYIRKNPEAEKRGMRYGQN